MTYSSPTVQQSDIHLAQFFKKISIPELDSSKFFYSILTI